MTSLDHFVDLWLQIGSEVLEVPHARADVLRNGGKVNVGDLALLAELADDGGNGRVMAVRDPREEVVLNLVVKPPIKEAEQWASHVRGAEYLEEGSEQCY